MNRLLIILMFAGLSSCTSTVEEREVYSVLYDTTDTLLATPKANDLWDFTDGNNGNKHLTVRYATLSDVDMNVVKQLKRPPAVSGLFANAVQEKKRLERFKQEFDSLFDYTDSIGASHSAIFKPILSELSHLSRLPNTQTKHLIVYSNLMENSDWLSYYTTVDLLQLRHKSDELIQRYEKQIPIDGVYSGVSLHIIYKPTDFNDNTRFSKLRMIYQEVFEKLGVPVTFSANLSNANREL